MKQAILTQHAIGQGGFYTGILELENDEKFSYVYDCGSVTSKRKKNGKSTGKKEFLCKEIDQFIQDVDGKIDIIFISHLDRDHINGLKYLLNKRNATHKTEIILPYLNLEDALYFLVQESIQKNLIADQFHFLFPFESSIPYENISLSYFTSERDFERLENTINTDENSEDNFRFLGDKRKIEDKEIFFLRNDKVDSVFLYKKVWKFIPYCNHIHANQRKDLTTFFIQNFGSITYNNIESILKNNKKVRVLKDYFEQNINNDHNDSSLCIYSLPNELAYSFSIENNIHQYWDNLLFAHYSNKLGWLYTGDINLIQNISFFNFFNQLLQDNYSIFCVPHHGSKNNFNGYIFNGINQMPPMLFTISCGERNTYHHPHSSVVNIINRYYFHGLQIITEERNSLKVTFINKGTH